MKKLALTSLAILFSGCGADTLFNEPTTDMQSCVVGNWSNEGKLPEDTYEENYTFFADGTMQHEKRYEIPYLLGYVMKGAQELDYIPRYNIVRETGAWEYREGLFYIATQYEKNAIGRTEADALASVSAVTPVGVPLASSPAGTEIKGSYTHCDEEFFKTGVMKKIQENPLTYRYYSERVSRSFALYDSGFDNLTLLPDGTGTYASAHIPATGETSSWEYPIEYSYQGYTINTIYTPCVDCEPVEDQFIDHGYVLTVPGTSYFVRKN
ncbi:hypothetical protein [uncultured Thalassolituus sp.]|uniref:hypothetical protein n=1 Tax=uncultured Thalassolituus sp. TaxID=285273 RepID=UPI00261C2B25|nr:hypothetical protein [uncultured Thalassolituus sp.]